MKNKNKTFLRGAIVLATANLVVKIIGAVFKIPLYELIGKEGSGIFNVAYQIYTFMFIIATAGFPIAVSKMVAESVARNDEYEAKRVFETARILLGIIGIIGSLVLYTFSDSLAKMLGNNDAALSIRVISPAVFFVSLVSAYRGYFQGQQNMYPTAGSEVIEAGAKLGIGIITALFFLKMTVNPELSNDFSFALKEVSSIDTQTQLAASGAIFGVTVGTVLSLLLMMLVYSCGGKGIKPLNGIKIRRRSSIMKELILIAIPITIGASVSSLTSLVDLATIMNRLVVNPQVFEQYSFLFGEGTEFAKIALSEGWDKATILEKQANSLYGMYTGQAQTMFNLPLTIVVALSMSIVPAISTASVDKKTNESKTMIQSVLRITMIFAMPCAVGLSVLSKPILGLLYSDADAYILLQKLAIAVVFVSIVSVSNAVLQACGKVYYPVISMLIGGVAKVSMNYFCIPIWGIDGAPIATNVCYFIIAVLNIIYIIRVIKVKLSIKDMILKPLSAALIMGAVAIIIYNFFSGIIESRLVTIAAIAVGAVVYLVVISLLRGFKREDILNMPKGEKIAAILTKYKLL